MLNGIRYQLDKSLFTEPIHFGDIDLIQIGRNFCGGSHIIPKHIHLNWFELTVVTGGCGAIITNDISVPVKRGDIYLSFPCDAHKIISDAENPLKYDYIAFWSYNKEISEEFEKIMVGNYDAQRRIFRDERVSSLIGNAIAEINSEYDSPYATELLTSIFKQMIIYVIRDFKIRDVNKKSYNPTNAQAFCYQLMNYIDTHIHSIKTLEELAQVTGYNYSYLSALFKKTTSNTLSKYYSDKRLELSKVMLSDEGLTITDIAELLNYSSRFTFSKAFSNKYGISPGNYRSL